MPSLNNSIHYRAQAERTIQQALRRDWYLTEEERALLSKWYVLKWNAQYFAGKVLHSVPPDSRRIKPEGVDTIVHDGITYCVVYKNCYFGLVNAADFAFLSFRLLKGSTHGVVLVRPLWRIKGRTGAENTIVKGKFHG